jgi:hypothetical protein
LRVSRGSICIIKVLRLTTCPVSTLSCKTSPEARVFTSTVVSARMVPVAWAETMISRRSTGIVS